MTGGGRALAVIFDLDGTLVQTERLKALSYARAAVELCPYTVSERQVLEAYKEVLGLPRQEVASTLVERFDLAERARARMDALEVGAPWQAFVEVRLGYYEEMIGDPEVLRKHGWPHTVALLELAQETGCRTALATMSGRVRAQQVLQVLRLEDAFDVVATRDDVMYGKPHSEIYRLVCSELGVPARQSLVIEDSPSGVEAALAAGLRCIAVTTPFTQARIHDQGLLEERWIVDDPDLLAAVAHQVIEASGSGRA